MLIGPEIFVKKIAERQFERNRMRVIELREILRQMWPPVTPEGEAYIHDTQIDLRQIHLFNMFMLDICGATATINPTRPTPGPSEAA